MHLLIRFILLVACLNIGIQSTYAGSDFDSNAIVVIKVSGKKDFCTGVVVGANDVLTATHCIYELGAQTYYPPNTINIGIGDNITEDDIQWFAVTKISYKPSAAITNVNDFLGNDIVRLTTPGSLPVTPVAIASGTDSNTALTAWGFGEDEWGYYGLKKSRPLENSTFDDKMIAFTSGACRGDSGGPILNASNHLVGIISVSEVRHCVESGNRFAQRVGYSRIRNY